MTVQIDFCHMKSHPHSQPSCLMDMLPMPALYFCLLCVMEEEDKGHSRDVFRRCLRHRNCHVPYNTKSVLPAIYRLVYSYSHLQVLFCSSYSSISFSYPCKSSIVGLSSAKMWRLFIRFWRTFEPESCNTMSLFI